MGESGAGVAAFAGLSAHPGAVLLNLPFLYGLHGQGCLEVGDGLVILHVVGWLGGGVPVGQDRLSGLAWAERVRPIVRRLGPAMLGVDGSDTGL